jgi:methionyl-tRNA formyltransferase
MRILFMGTAELACPCLDAVARLPDHQVVAVITQPDRPKGRDLKPAPPPVKVIAEKSGLTVHQPLRMRELAASDLVRGFNPDLIIVVAYGQILPQAIIEIPPHGCVNVHASLLPRWRGAAPIQYAILHGDRETGVTTMFMDEHMDTGDIILQRAESIQSDDTSATLHDRLAKLGASLLVETVQLLSSGRPPRVKQNESNATYAKKLTKEDGRIEWTKPAVQIEHQIRAFDPWPGAYTFLGDTMLKIWKAEVVGQEQGVSGRIKGDLVATGAGVLRLLEVQPAGGKRMSFAAFARGQRIAGTASFR